MNLAAVGYVSRFLTVGAGNTVIGLATIYLGKIAGLGDVLANVVGYAVGILVSFMLNKRWTFRHDGPALRAFGRFVTVVLIAYLLNLATVVLALNAGVNSYLAQALGVLPYALFSYWGSKHYAFRSGSGGLRNA